MTKIDTDTDIDIDKIFSHHSCLKLGILSSIQGNIIVCMLHFVLFKYVLSFMCIIFSFWNSKQSHVSVLKLPFHLCTHVLHFFPLSFVIFLHPVSRLLVEFQQLLFSSLMNFKFRNHVFVVVGFISRKSILCSPCIALGSSIILSVQV